MRTLDDCVTNNLSANIHTHTSSNLFYFSSFDSIDPRNREKKNAFKQQRVPKSIHFFMNPHTHTFTHIRLILSYHGKCGTLSSSVNRNHFLLFEQ